MKKYKVNISGAIIFHRLHDLHCNGIKSSPFALSLSLSPSLCTISSSQRKETTMKMKYKVLCMCDR